MSKIGNMFHVMTSSAEETRYLFIDITILFFIVKTVCIVEPQETIEDLKTGVNIPINQLSYKLYLFKFEYSHEIHATSVLKEVMKIVL